MPEHSPHWIYKHPFQMGLTVFGVESNGGQVIAASLKTRILCWGQGTCGMVGAQAEVSTALLPAHRGLLLVQMAIPCSFPLPHHSQSTSRARQGWSSKSEPLRDKGMVMSDSL